MYCILFSNHTKLILLISVLSNRTLSRFNFIAQVVHTFKTYIYETRSTGEFQMHSSMNDDLSKLKKIVALSTLKTKKIFKMILEDHVKHKDDKTYQGILYLFQSNALNNHFYIDIYFF